MKASALQGMRVVAMASGVNLGTVEEVFFDTSQLTVEALWLQGGGVQLVLPFRSIESVGPDAVTVESASATVAVDAQPVSEGARSLTTIKNLVVISADGTQLGEVRDLEFDPKDGALTAIEVHRGGVLGIGGTNLSIARGDIRAIGTDLVTVTVQAQTESVTPPEPEAENPGASVADKPSP